MFHTPFSVLPNRIPNPSSPRHRLTKVVRVCLVAVFLAYLPYACTPAAPSNPEFPPTQQSASQPPVTVTVQATRSPRINSPTSNLALPKTTASPRPTNTQASPNPDPLNSSFLSTPTSFQTLLLSSDLLFISQEKLMRWDHVTDYVGVLAEGVISYSVSANGKIVAMQRTRNVTANGVEQFGLDLLDFETKQITSLIDQTPLLSHLSISPDARWIKFSYQENPVGIYTVQTGIVSRAIGLPQQTNSPVELDLGEAQRDSPSEDILWSPDGQSLLWENPLGIWLYILATGEIRLIRSNIVTVSDPQNKTNEIEVSFQALDWSPAGRFALATVFPSSSDVSWQAILDTLTGRLVQIPDSYENNDWESDVDWMQNGDLLVMHASDSDNQKPPFIKVYHVFPTRNELLVFIDYQEIGEEFLRLHSSFSNLLAMNLIWPHSLDARTLRMGITSGTASKPFLFSIDLQIDKLEKLLDLPQDTFDVLWTPDGQNALVLGTKGQIFFVALPRGPLRDVRPVLGKNAHDFFWLPPVPHF